MSRAAFYATARSKLGRLSQKQVDGFEIILAASEGLPRSHRAYLLATCWHETGATMQPIKETEREGVRRTDAQVVNILDAAWKAGRLPWVGVPYWRFDKSGKAWFGRGYVQLTHRDNYAKAAALTGVDLLGDPTRAMNPTVAAEILVAGSQVGLFTGKKLRDYLPGDYLGARRIINGTDKAQLIAGYAEVFERALQAAGVSEAPSTTAKPEPPPAAKKPGLAGQKAPAISLIGIAIAALAYWWAEVTQRVVDFFNAMFGG